VVAVVVSCAVGLTGVGLTAAAGTSAPAGVPPIHPTLPSFEPRAVISPQVVRLGERALYRAQVTGGIRAQLRLLPPEAIDALTWGTPRVYGRHGWQRKLEAQPYARYTSWSLDTMAYELPVQAFVLGRLTIPGPQVEIDDGRGPRLLRLPSVELIVVPVLSAADSAAELRGLRGPLAAPWWETVPWLLVAAALIAAGLIAVVLRARRRPPARTGAPAPRRAPALDPAAEALAALAALRALNLPEHGRFAEHAFRLGQLLRQFLERVIVTTRPGDTTPELVAHLREAGLEAEDLGRLAGLLRVWDRVKFAREPFTMDEAVRAERAVEAFLRRPASAPRERVA